MTAPRGEFEWIDRLEAILGDVARDARGRAAIGNDVAWLPEGGPWAWTVDTLVEGVHFRFDWLDPAAVGHRALAASLSDLAAAGSTPAGALVTAAGPAGTLADGLEALYEGMAALARRSGCPVLGGDLSRAEGPLHVTVTAIGRVVGGESLGRGGARPGDVVWVTGELGAPAAAVAALERGAGAGDPAAVERVRAGGAYPRLAYPEPRTREIAWLLERRRPSASIDLSDGLSGDAGHVAAASAARILIDPARLPVHPAAARLADDLGGDALAWALHGGEEFELLLTAPEGAFEPLAADFEAAFGIRLTPIGRVERGSGVFVRDASGERPLEPRSWDHFAPRERR